MTHGYRSLEDFEREQIRPGLRAGWSVDDVVEPGCRSFDFDVDPFGAAFDDDEDDTEDEDEDDDEESAPEDEDE